MSAMPERPATLLEFEAAQRHLRLGTQVDLGVQTIPLAQVIGTVGRGVEFDGSFRPRSLRMRRLIDHIGSARPDGVELPIQVYQVGQAYFVMNGHKRVSLAIADGQQYIDAQVTRISSRFRVDERTTIESIRATEDELRFREKTGLTAGAPGVRFPLSDPDGYLDLEESVKAHGYDLSVRAGQLLAPEDAARHWYEFVFRQATALARDAGYDAMLSGSTDADRFLIMRHGNRELFSPDWEISPPLADRSLTNLAASRGNPRSRLERALRRRRVGGEILPEVAEQRPEVSEREADEQS
jgi:hypothetical protein